MDPNDELAKDNACDTRLAHGRPAAGKAEPAARRVEGQHEDPKSTIRSFLLASGIY